MKLLSKGTSTKLLYIFIFLIPFLVYWNSFDNEYSMDDHLAVDGITKIAQGISCIPKIFTTPYSTDKNQAYGYRPISSSSFALEKQFFSGLPAKQSPIEKKTNNLLTQANISHIINVVLYALTGVLLFYFMSILLPKNNWLLPFLIAFIFILLPIHSEVVNNIKSRDTLLEFMGILSSLLFYVKYGKDGQLRHLLLGMLCLIFAVYSKKSAVAVIGVAPAVLYFSGTNYKKIATVFLSTLLLVVVAIFLKKGLVVTTSVRHFQYHENPLFHQGNFFDRLATGFYCAYFYLKMMIFPKEFSFYYGFSKIPIVNWSFHQVWLGILIFVPLAIYGIKQFFKKDLLGLGVVIWLGVMLGFINIVFPMVGIVAERFAYVFSLGFSIVVGVLLVRLFKLEIRTEYHKIVFPKAFLIITAIIVVSYSIKIIARNSAWENYETLYRSDIDHLKNSAKANELLATLLFGKALKPVTPLTDYQKGKLLGEAIRYYKNALAITPDYNAVLNNLGFIHLYTGRYNKAIPLLKKAEKKEGGETISNLAFAYYRSGKIEKSIPYFIRTISLFPNRRNSYPPLFNIAKNPKYEHKIQQDLAKISPQIESHSFVFDIKMANYYQQNGNRIKALYYYEKALLLQPSNDKLRRLIENIRNTHI